MPTNELAQLYDVIRTGRTLPEPIPTPAPGLFGGIAAWWDRLQVDRAYSRIGRHLIKSMETQAEAAEQGTVVNAAFDALGMYGDGLGGEIVDATGFSMGLLRLMAHTCHPITMCIETWVRYGTAFCDRPDKRSGVVKRPGFEIRMTSKKEKATHEDRENMELITQFLLETGFCEPPDNEKPVGWQPGLASFVSQILRDTLTFDGAAIRRWIADAEQALRLV